MTKKYDIKIISSETSPDSLPIEETTFYKEMQKNRIGNLLEAARLNAGIKQAELAEKIGIKQNIISDFENGRRKLTKEMIARISKVLDVSPNRLAG